MTNKNIPHLAIGNFSNTLIRANGFDGMLIKLSGEFSKIEILKNSIYVGSSVLDNKFSIFCYENSISGYEYLYTIPGTIGGNIYMNAGCYGYEFMKCVKNIIFFDTLTLTKKSISIDKIDFTYRKGLQMDNIIILGAELIYNQGEKKIIKSKMKDFNNQRLLTQPQKVNCCGSIFKNPKKLSAWSLIQSSIDDSFYKGDIKLSKKHSNFFENAPNLNPVIIESFLNKVEKKVFEKHNIKLEKELMIIGG